MPTCRFDDLGDQGIVTRQRMPHSLRLRFPQPGAAFDVGEHEGNDAGRQRHRATLHRRRQEPPDGSDRAPIVEPDFEEPTRTSTVYSLNRF